MKKNIVLGNNAMIRKLEKIGVDDVSTGVNPKVDFCWK